MSKGYHEEGSSMIHNDLPRLTADDIVDLSRWFSANFANKQTEKEAYDRYHAYLERQRESRKPE